MKDWKDSGQGTSGSREWENRDKIGKEMIFDKKGTAVSGNSKNVLNFLHFY